MDIAFDPAKNEVNRTKHGLDLATAQHFDFATALGRIDARTDYGEQREVAIGFIGERLHVLVFTRRGATIRVISLRKANKREIGHYVENIG